MKNTKIMITLAILLAAVLLSGVVAADAIGVTKGQDVFVTEHIQLQDLNATKLIQYSDGASPQPLYTIAGESGNFYLSESAINGHYGQYYWQGNPTYGGDYIFIWYPTISMGVELASAEGESINNKTITTDTQIRFLIDSPQLSPAFASPTRDAILSANLVFTTPEGGKTYQFGRTVFRNLPFDGKTQIDAGTTVPGLDAMAGVYSVYAEYNTKPFDTYAKKSNTVVFTVQSSSLSLKAAQDSVIRNNPFAVTINGKAETLYAIGVQGTIAGSPTAPNLLKNQVGYQDMIAREGNTDYYIFKTDAAGQRVVQFNTEGNTEEKTYTIKVHGVSLKYNDVPSIDLSTYDTAKIRVDKGSVTIIAAGSSSHYIGDEIKLSGTNTDSKQVYLFITGQNLIADGVALKMLPQQQPARNGGYAFVSVNTDNTWEYKWSTANCALDTGAYTIYATSKLTNGKANTPTWNAVKLADSEYATVSINLKQPFLSANAKATIIANGDKLILSGTAEGKPTELKLYIFGPNFFLDDTITVNDDGSYEKKLAIPNDMAQYQYFAVIQHPMYNGVFDAVLDKWDSNHQFFYILNAASSSDEQSSFVVTGPDRLQGSQAADALCKMINSANIDDIYTKLTFTVAAPWIKINNIGDHPVGSVLNITGVTNLAENDQLIVTVHSSVFKPGDKSEPATTSGVTIPIKVVKGVAGGDNIWSAEVNTTNWQLDEYSITVEGTEVGTSTTAYFHVVKQGATPTKQPTDSPTKQPTDKTPTTPTKTPGFGALGALAGLGAVAALILRRH